MFLTLKSLKLAKKIRFCLGLIMAIQMLCPQLTVRTASAQVLSYGQGPVQPVWINDPNNIDRPLIKEKFSTKLNSTNPTLSDQPTLPYRVIYVTATAYSSRVEECDDDPYIAAWGDHVYWGMIASNGFPYNTKIQIPDLYGDKIFAVKDRMNKRYSSRIDVWMPETAEAKQFGVKYIKVRILN